VDADKEDSEKEDYSSRNFGNVDLPQASKNDPALVRFLQIANGNKKNYVKAGQRFLGYIEWKKPNLSTYGRFAEVDLLRERFELMELPPP